MLTPPLTPIEVPTADAAAPFWSEEAGTVLAMPFPRKQVRGVGSSLESWGPPAEKGRLDADGHMGFTPNHRIGQLLV